MLVEHKLEWALHMACRRLIERLAALNCAAPSAQLPEPARHVTDSNRPTDEQMHAGVLVCVSGCVCLCGFDFWSLFRIIISFFMRLKAGTFLSETRATNAN